MSIHFPVTVQLGSGFACLYKCPSGPVMATKHDGVKWHPAGLKLRTNDNTAFCSLQTNRIALRDRSRIRANHITAWSLRTNHRALAKWPMRKDNLSHHANEGCVVRFAKTLPAVQLCGLQEVCFAARAVSTKLRGAKICARLCLPPQIGPKD